MKEENNYEEIEFCINNKPYFFNKKDSNTVMPVLNDPTKEGLQDLYKKELIYKREEDEN